MRIQDQGERLVIDACVLAVFAVADLLLLIAEHSACFTPRWTEHILEEMHRAHLKFGWGERVAASFHACLNLAFPEAQVSGYEPLIARCTNDEGDRHVLAAAIKGQVSRIVTFNLDDFSKESLAPWGITAVHPSDYLLELYARDGKAVRKALGAQALKYRVKVEQRLVILAEHVPAFANKLLAEAKFVSTSSLEQISAPALARKSAVA